MAAPWDIVTFSTGSDSDSWSEVLPHLDYESATELFAAVAVVWGVAYIFRISLRFIYNQR